LGKLSGYATSQNAVIIGKNGDTCNSLGYSMQDEAMAYIMPWTTKEIYVGEVFETEPDGGFKNVKVSKIPRGIKITGTITRTRIMESHIYGWPFIGNTYQETISEPYESTTNDAFYGCIGFIVIAIGFMTLGVIIARKRKYIVQKNDHDFWNMGMMYWMTAICIIGITWFVYIVV
jgi:hypothetical protein